jgi:hypothetical protein
LDGFPDGWPVGAGVGAGVGEAVGMEITKYTPILSKMSEPSPLLQEVPVNINVAVFDVVNEFVT